MKNSAILFFILIFSLTIFPQKPKPAKKPAANASKTVKTPVTAGNEKEEFEKAVAIADNTERIAALQKFIENFPQSADKTRAQELVVSARAAIADEKLRLSETESGVELFKLAAKDAPKPVADKFFNEILLKFPTNLFWRGQREAALEIARTIEEKADGNAKQLLGLSTFYLGTENALEAQRLANKAIAIELNLPAAYQTLGLAYRLNFQLEESATAYAKALELDPNSVVSKRSLAEMKRAVGKSDEAAALYREILAVSNDDSLAQTGFILSLFDAEKRTEAEVELNKSLDANPKNLMLLVGAAYWYAAHQEGAKAIELAEKAIAVEPRYTWAHIALARGLNRQNRPLEAEKTLLIARQYGNFPTLDYEIATARMQAGFFREAAEELTKNFTVDGENIKTKLGGRVVKESNNFIELLASERRASIFQPLAADDLENSNKLRALLDFEQKINAPQPDETAISQAADEVVKGDDKMKVHRELFAANRLLQKKVALAKAFELSQQAVGNTDAALEIPSASAAVLADELYESRTTSINRNQFLLVPDVPRQTLSAILRGRIEEIAGWTLYQQSKPAEAVVRLKRAVSVLPDKSTWWRSSMWRLGAALEADGKDKDALDSYIKSYPKDTPEGSKYFIIESLYKKINGNTDGLEAKIGQKPASAFNPTPASETVAQTTEKPAEQPTATPEIKNETVPTPETKPEPTPETKPELKAEKPAETTATPEVLPTPETSPTPEIKTEASPIPEVKSTPEIGAESKPLVNSTPEAQPTPTETPNAQVEPKTEITPEKSPEPTPQNLPVTEAAPTPQTSATPKPLFDPIVITIPRLEPLKSPSPEIKETETAKVEANSQTPEITEKPVEKPPEKLAEKPIDENVNSGASRLRVVVEDNLAKPANQACALIVSQESISLLNGGGSVGVLVGFENIGDLSAIQASSNSPNDIEVSFEPEIGALSGRAFFIVKSISTNVGEYKVAFAAPCGKKEITVRVR